MLVDKPIQANLDKSSRRSALWHSEIKATWCILFIRGARSALMRPKGRRSILLVVWRCVNSLFSENRNTALKEIGKIYTVQGRKFLLSFPAPYTCDQLKARGLSSRLAQSASSTQHMCMVGAVGWEPYGSSPTTCAEKTDHELPCHLPARDFFFICPKVDFH